MEDVLEVYTWPDRIVSLDRPVMCVSHFCNTTAGFDGSHICTLRMWHGLGAQYPT
jgi:hypothetical protein